MTDLEFEVDRALLQLSNYRNNFSPTDFCDDVMSCAKGALIHQQEMLRKQDAAIKQLRDALTQVVDASERGMAAVSTFILIDAKEALATTENIHG